MRGNAFNQDLLDLEVKAEKSSTSVTEYGTIPNGHMQESKDPSNYIPAQCLNIMIQNLNFNILCLHIIICTIQNLNFDILCIHTLTPRW